LGVLELPLEMVDVLELNTFTLHNKCWQEKQKHGINSYPPKAVEWAASKAGNSKLNIATIIKWTQHGQRT
jgi:hypothetical protein